MAQASSASVVIFESAKAARYGDFRDGGLAVPADRWVWAVAFTGTFHSSGGPAALPGQITPPADQHSILVFLDYTTGDFIQASVPGPYVPDY
jgi:hypothetical protein